VSCGALPTESETVAYLGNFESQALIHAANFLNLSDSMRSSQLNDLLWWLIVVAELQVGIEYPEAQPFTLPVFRCILRYVCVPYHIKCVELIRSLLLPLVLTKMCDYNRSELQARKLRCKAQGSMAPASGAKSIYRTQFVLQPGKDARFS
jgi:hypothetical protein